MALTLPSAVSGVGMISVPVFAMLYHWVMTKKKPALIQIISGILLISLAWHLFNPGSIRLSLVGLGAMLTAIMCLIIGSNLTKNLASEIHWWALLTWQLIIGGIALLIIALFHATIDTQPYLNAFNQLTMLNIAGLAWLIIFATALAYGLYVWLLQKMTVVEFTFGGIANPIAGILAGYILMNEGFTSEQYLLMVLMIATSLLPLAIAIIKRKMMLYINKSRNKKG
jgi:drug/metabolite transporter (DMT)-like permease